MSGRLRLLVISVFLAGAIAYTVLPSDISHRIIPFSLAQMLSPPIDADPVAAHKALYGLELVSMGSGSGIVGIRGKMYFEQDDACDAWTTDQRFTTEYQYPESQSVINTNHYVAWEAKDHSLFQFSSERQENGEIVERLRGQANRLEDGSGKAEYIRPDNVTFDLPAGYSFPTAHSMEIARHAREGDTFFNAVMFDGTDAEGPVEVMTVVGKQVTSAELDKIASAVGNKIDKNLLVLPAWHVRMAVFPLHEEEDIMPAYEMDMILHDNGIVSYALIDYKLFKLEQTLLALEKIPQKECQ